MSPRLPQEREVLAGGLRHRVLEWGARSENQPTIFFVHGYLDCGASFTPIVDALPESLHCVAPDLRGHGETEWVGPGGYYHFFDYVRDLRDLVDTLAGPRLVLVGHSMGGGIATLFTGSWPDDVELLVLIEGLGPPAEDEAEGPKRIQRWLREVRAQESQERKTFASLDDVAKRLRRQWPTLSELRSMECARWMTRPTEDGRWVWCYDPLHRTRTPQVFRPERWTPFLEAITCPTLTMTGGRSWYKWPDLEARREHIRERSHVHLKNGSHMLHLDCPHDVASEIARRIGGRD